jgi:prepilin-type N-terminal cleavage/methylation domain-containing protein
VRDSHGFTIIEVLLAIILLTVGLLAMATSGLFVSGMLDRSGRAATATNFAVRRLELLRPRACAPTSQRSGSELLVQGSTVVATSHWWFTASLGVVHVAVATTYFTLPGRTRTDTLTTAVLC